MQLQGPGIRVALQQPIDRGLRILKQRLAFGGIREESLDRAGVLRMKSRLDSLEHVGEPVPPCVGDPRAARRCGVGGAVAVTDRQLDVTVQPLQVGHAADVAEVGLGRVGHRRDQLVTTGRHGIRVAGDLVEQPAAPRGGVVDLVNVRAQLATAGSHAAVGFSGADPVIGAGRLDQHLLDGRRGGGLQGRHGRGTDENSVDRHLGKP